MKKLAFGLTLMVSASLIFLGTMIGAGLEINGINTHSGSWFRLGDSGATGPGIMLSVIMFLLGLVISAIEAFKKSER